MRPAWSSFLALVAAAAAFDAHIAAAGTTEVHARAAVFSAQDFRPSATGLAAIADSETKFLLPLQQWIGESYARAPALLLGLSVVMVVPPLALAGLIARRKRRTSAAPSPSPDTTLALTRAGKRGVLETNTLKTEGFSWPTE